MTQSESTPLGNDTNKKFFTLDEARRSLPYVSRIVGDIVACYQGVLDARNHLEMPQPTDDVDEVKRVYDDGMSRLNGLVQEVKEVGVELKDFERGLVDFPAMHDGREINLCWHHGEDTIVAWHEVDSGYSGRQDVTLLEPIGAGAGGMDGEDDLGLGDVNN